MQNIGIVCDVQWDNFILINNKLKKINPEHYRIQAIYCKSLEIINNCCTRNMLTLIRNYSDTLSKTVFNMLKICDLWIIFTNFTEFNNPSRLIIEKCEVNNIKYIIVSEYSRDIDYYSFPIDRTLSFKKILSKITKNNNNLEIEEFNEQIYNDFFINKNNYNNIKLDFILKIQQKYNESNLSKKERSIQLLYDKDEIKREKQAKKTIKEMTMIDFSTNKMNYYTKS